MVFMSTEWIELSLKDICDNKTVTSKNFDLDEIERYVGLEHIQPENLNITTWGLVEEGTTFTKVFYPGQVLFGKRRSYQKKAALADFKGVCSGDILVLEAKKDIILPELLPYIIQNDDLFDFAVGTSSGSLSPRTSWKHLSSYKIKVPIHKESQMEIVDKFIKLEKAITFKNQLIIATEKYKKSLMRQLLIKGIGHTKFKQTEFDEIPNEWEIVNLEEICDFLDNRRKPIKSSDRDKIQGIYPYYGASGIIDFVNDFIFDEELILLAEDGENIRSRNLPIAFKVQGKIWVNNHAHVLKIKDNSKDVLEYIVYALEIKDYTPFFFGSAQPKLNQKECRKLLIPRPSFEEQKKISTILTTLDNQIQNYQKEKETKIQLKKALQRNLLSSS